MKKALLLLSAGFVSFGAWAQENKSGSLMLANPQQENRSALSVPDNIKQDIIKFREERNKVLKNTAGGTRVFNYLRYLAALDPSVLNSYTLPYMWFDFNGMAIYQGATSLELDTIPLSSVATVLHPQSEILNGAYYFDDLYPNPGTAMMLTNADAYVLDSVSFSSVYGRNRAKYDVVDTLRFAIVYGDGTPASNLQIGRFTNLRTQYGYDTVEYVRLPYDSVAHTATNLPGGPNVIIKDIYLDSFANTEFSGNYAFTVPVNLSIPAGNYVAASATFISGDPSFVPFADTVFAGSATPNRPFKYGMMRPFVYEESVGNFPTYHPGDRNSGGFKFLPPTNGWNASYIPTFAYIVDEAQFEYNDFDFFISCATCDKVVGVNKVSDIITSVAAYPNPATDFVQIPVTVSQSASVKVSLVNTVGQVVDARDLGTVAAGTSASASFSTAHLAPGVYLYTVDAAGQRQTGRFVVAR